MTDNEIIKAVECCTGNTKCCECPMFRTPNCMNKAFGYALDLINRQKAEIERLEKENKDKERAYTDEYCLRKEWQSKCRDLLEEKQTVKSKSIKEFAEKLKERLTGIGRSTTYGNFEYGTIKSYELDSLVKEMTDVEVNQRKEDEWK